MMRKPKPAGLTLIELLIVIAIMSLLFQLVLPAIQTAQESARQALCMNNVRQLALGCQMHSNMYGHFPTGGWSSGFIGDPNRGYGKKQPGAWGFNILPFIEQQELHDLGTNLPDAERSKSAAQLYGSVVRSVHMYFSAPRSRIRLF